MFTLRGLCWYLASRALGFFGAFEQGGYRLRTSAPRAKTASEKLTERYTCAGSRHEHLVGQYLQQVRLRTSASRMSSALLKECFRYARSTVAVSIPACTMSTYMSVFGCI